MPSIGIKDAALVGLNANIVNLDRNLELAEKIISNFPEKTGGRALAVYGDVLDKAVLEQALEKIDAEFGKVDKLNHAAVGNHPSATTEPDLSFFDLPLDALRFVGAGPGGRSHWQEASQALGQRSLSFVVWIALTFINPLVAMGPTFYLLYHHLYNSWLIDQCERGRVA